jgi:hypothetical protein
MEILNVVVGAAMMLIGVVFGAIVASMGKKQD